MTAAARASGLRHFLPESGRLWIRHTPAAWPGGSGWWTHLADRCLGAERSGEVPDLDPAAADDVVYLPPVAPEARSAAAARAARLEGAGCLALQQWAVGETGEPQGVLDPLAALVEDGVGALEGLESACRTAVWPLVPAVTDDPAVWEAGFAALRRKGFETVVPMALELDPAGRRRLADRVGDAGFHALFHGPPPDERACARAVAAAGMRPFAARPPLAGPPRRAFARRVAGELAHAGDLWLRLRRSEAAGQELLRAARWVERADHDFRALAREGNLEVVPWLEPRSRSVVEDLAAGRPPVLIAELEAEYLGGSA